MQTLGLQNSGNRPKTGFWKRQFEPQATVPQAVFDWIFGVALPAICFIFDPIVFKSGNWGMPVFGAFKPFAYLLSFVSIMAMAAWLIWGERLKWLNGFLAGLFFTGAAVSLAVGVVLLPFSLIGLAFLIGILGFTPFLTVFIYLRNGCRALLSAKPLLEKSVLVYAVGFGVIFSAVVPAVINLEIRNSLENIRRGDAQAVRDEAFKLKMTAPLLNTENIALIYRETWAETEEDAAKKQALAELYREITGDDVDQRSNMLND